MRGCLAPPKNSAQTTGRGAAGCFFAPQTAPRRTQQGKKRASALVAVSRLLKMAATNVLLPGASKVAAQPRKGGLRRPRSVTWSVTWSVIRSINQRWVPHDWKTCLVTHRLTHPRSSPLCSSVPLCFKTHLSSTHSPVWSTQRHRENRVGTWSCVRAWRQAFAGAPAGPLQLPSASLRQLQRHAVESQSLRPARTYRIARFCITESEKDGDPPEFLR
jgi:hypothetical protein